MATDSNNFKKRTGYAVITGIASLGTLFFAAHSNALTDDAAEMALPSVQAQTQTQIQVSNDHGTVLGTITEYGVSTNNCDNSIENFALSSLTQSTGNPQTNPNSGSHNSGPTYAAYQSPHYNYTCTNGWGAFDGCGARGNNWLMWPPSYDIQCRVNMPNVVWAPN